MKFLKIAICLWLPALSGAQQSLTDSLRHQFFSSTDDSIRYEAAIRLYDYYEELNRDSAFFYGDQSAQISRKSNKKLNEAYSLTRKAYQEVNMGRFAEALHSLLDAFSISEKKENDKYYWAVHPLRQEQQKRLYALSCTHHIYGILMRETKNREQEIIHFREAKRIAVEINSPARSVLGSLNLGRIYLEAGNLDSALYYENEAEAIARKSGREKYLSGALFYKGIIYLQKGDTTTALSCFYEGISSGTAQNNFDGLVRAYRDLSQYYADKQNKDSSLYYALKQLDISKKLGAVSALGYHIGVAYENVYLVYQLRHQFDSAYKYLALTHRTNDSINQARIKSLAEFQKLTLDEQQRLQNAEKEKVAYRNKIRIYFLLAGIGVLLLLAIIFYRNNRQKHKAKIKIEQAYDHLKATQQQLIQSEKMASLGELTAGIAHEIQNPLNFVNNFSDVNRELVDELKSELATGNNKQAIEIADDIRANEEKINHHGKRADSIVKGMLQHSRSSTGQKESTDINTLTDEYLRLAFHGLRAKDKSFNANLKTDFDNSIGKVNIVPQDIGRVILNLINNAFYAVDEKQKQRLNGYKPIVTLSTKKEKDRIEIKVKDNANGIPQKVLGKIFQPFFTTKPTGQGTGLGLSLAYDIVKAHGGELKVETKEGEGSEFTIQIPHNH
ncbi:MAG TPA: ATP-binding protein [Chitinophagaceae bacterium]|nr:ATP-binding protein [Chitinophagaceae bacterium]